MESGLEAPLLESLFSMPFNIIAAVTCQTTGTVLLVYLSEFVDGSACEVFMAESRVVRGFIVGLT